MLADIVGGDGGRRCWEPRMTIVNEKSDGEK